MTTITSTKFLALKKNKTGLFAAHSIHDMKPAVPMPETHRRTNSVASLFNPSSERRQRTYCSVKPETEQYSSLNGSPGNSTFALTGGRSGFLPSTIRRERMRLMATTPPSRQRSLPPEHRDSSTRSTMMQSHASARLKSEVDYLQNKLKKHGETSRSVRLPDSRDLNSSSHATLSYSTSCRPPSASTIQAADRIHKRFSSAVTHKTINTLLTMSKINDASTQTLPLLSKSVVLTVPPIPETTTQHQTDGAEDRPTYAYQIPQQSNVGCESVFLTDASVHSGVKTPATGLARSRHQSRSMTCPFYVMYLTNLTMQHAQSADDRTLQNDYPLPASSVRKVPANSRATPRTLLQHPSIRNQVNGPTSVNTYLSIDNNVGSFTPSPASLRHTRLSTAMDNEHSSKLGDILRTTPCNHVKV